MIRKSKNSKKLMQFFPSPAPEEELVFLKNGAMHRILYLWKSCHQLTHVAPILLTEYH